MSARKKPQGFGPADGPHPLPDVPFHRCPCGAKATERATWPHDDAGPAKSHVGFPVEGGHWVLDTCAEHTAMYRQTVGG